MKNYLLWTSNKKIQLTFLFLVTLIISIQRYFVTPDGWSGYNNYLIFKQSFFHLIDGKDLYSYFITDHQDFYKYSPSFALLMGVLAPLPNFLGLVLWNLLNVLILYLGIQKMPLKRSHSNLLFLFFILIELITSTQNSQCNALIAGMIMLAYYHLEKSNMVWATLLIVGTVYIKLFGIVAFALFLFYPHKLKASLFSVIWTALLGLIPLFVVSWPHLMSLYESWLTLLTDDHDSNVKFSVMGILNSWFGLPTTYKTIVLITGIIAFCIPLLRINRYHDPRFRLLFLSSILIWVIIFNHMAESATFIIAVTGIAIWFFTKDSINKLDIFLIILTILLTILSPTDLFPKSIRDNFLVPYTLKVLPCILIWLKINWEMLFKTSHLHYNTP